MITVYLCITMIVWRNVQDCDDSVYVLHCDILVVLCFWSFDSATMQDGIYYKYLHGL